MLYKAYRKSLQVSNTPAPQGGRNGAPVWTAPGKNMAEGGKLVYGSRKEQ
jgi:hypothetical protein